MIDVSKIITAEQKQAAALEETKAAFSGAIQAHMDDFAKAHDYDTIHTGASYAGDPNPKYDAEGTAMRNWRSAVWVYANAEMAKVLTGQRPQPTIEEMIAELPVIQWPAS